MHAPVAPLAPTPGLCERRYCHGTTLLSARTKNTARTSHANEAWRLACDGSISDVIRHRSHVYYWRHSILAKESIESKHEAVCQKRRPWHAITFGSHGHYLEAARTVCALARHGGADSCAALSLADLPRHWRAAHGVQLGARGIGYWRWKPYIIRQRLKELSDGDILCYLDRDLLPSGSLSALFCLGQQSQSGVVGFHSACYREASWTKRELADSLNATSEHMDTLQVTATMSVWRRGAFALQFVAEYLAWASDARLSGDELNRSNQVAGFRAHRHATTPPAPRTHVQRPNCHYVTPMCPSPISCRCRHDQSIFSLLTKRHHLKTFPWPIASHDRRDVRACLVALTRSLRRAHASRAVCVCACLCICCLVQVHMHG